MINNEQDTPSTRVRAAALLAAVCRDEATPLSARLHCLAALDALAEPAAWAERDIGATADHATGDARITGALQLLGLLPLAEFGQPDVLTAARHARRALRELG